LLVAESKSGKSRRIPLTDEDRGLLESLTAPLAPADAVLTKSDGTLWKKNEQFERMREACAANISPPINFHAVRHTTGSLLVEMGVPPSGDLLSCYHSYLMWAALTQVAYLATHGCIGQD
jgi:integrase